MSDSTEFREEVRRAVRRHDPSPDELRTLADGLEELADRFEATDDLL